MSYKGRILLVDDDEKVHKFYSATFKRAGYISTACENLSAMRDELAKKSYDAIFLDLNLGQEHGLDGLPYVLKVAPYSKVFILTSQNSVEKAVQCMDQGADWYFTKGADPTGIIEKLESLLEDDATASSDEGQELWRSQLIGESKAIIDTCETIQKLKDVDSTVLILGESGTGKEVIARALHQSSNRKRSRFEAINCGAIPENLLESELFGHKRGAFTDAKADRKGIFEVCSTGTLLLDEIGDMPLALQTKLLRVLQEKQIQPVGSTSVVDINTRVIAATHRDIQDEIKSGRFREDLFYRLSVVVVEIPPLRHRKEDIPLLVDYFLEKFNKRFGKQLKSPSVAALSRLKNYDWPGNIRELQNAIERGVVLADGDQLAPETMFSHLMARSNRSLADSDHQHAMSQSWEAHEVFDMQLSDAKQFFEKSYMERLLRQCSGNMAEVARRSGRYRADLYRMLERYHIVIDDFRSNNG